MDMWKMGARRSTSTACAAGERPRRKNGVQMVDSLLDRAARTLAASLERANQDYAPGNLVSHEVLAIIVALRKDNGFSLLHAAIKQGTNGLLEHLGRLEASAVVAGPQALEAQRKLDRLIQRILSKRFDYFEARRAAGM
jgi:hypothetical protein